MGTKLGIIAVDLERDSVACGGEKGRGGATY